MDEIKIRHVEGNEAELLSKVALKAYTDHYLHLWHDNGDWYSKKYFSVEGLQKELNDTNSLFFIAYYYNKPVGFLKINIDAPIEQLNGRQALELERIYLNKAVEGKGIGKELVNLTFSVAKENKKEVVWLKAMDTSEGPIAFYKKMGFQIAGTHLLKHPLMKEELRGMVIMKKEL